MSTATKEPKPKHASPRDYEGHWKADGSPHDHAPKWAKYRTEMTSEFPSPFRGGVDPLAAELNKLVVKMDRLRPLKGGPAWLGDSGALDYKFPDVKNVTVDDKMGDIDTVLDDVVKMFNGAPNWGNPLTMCNVIPQANTAAIIASMLSQIFATNILEGEYAWNVHRAELESAGMLANLVGWDAKKAGGIFTYGGGGCWLYGAKYGLTRVLPDSRKKGVRTEAKIICSQQSHFARNNSSDWLGLGTDNIVLVRTDAKTNQMDVSHLEKLLKEFHSKGIPVATVVCTMGTTDASAFDPIAKVREVLDRNPNPKGYGKTVLYADCVVGWSWIYFKDYDFDKNPLEFSDRILPLLKQNGEAMKDIIHADAIGVDFHKVGWSSYVSSCFVYKNASEFESLLRWGGDAYLQVRTPYNPMYYTLEVSRTASGSLEAWATLKYFGMDGMRAILGGILETKYYLYDLIDEQADMVCVNHDDSGLITLYRAYPNGVDAKKQFERELTDPKAKADLVKHNKLTKAVGDKLFEWFRSGKTIDGKYTPYMSFSTGFRNTTYNQDGSDTEAVVYALKSFPMNVFVTPEIMQWVVRCVREARDEVFGKALAA
jgi:L-2,4-diaminobutyrate decarboxylase